MRFVQQLWAENCFEPFQHNIARTFVQYLKLKWVELGQVQRWPCTQIETQGSQVCNTYVGALAPKSKLALTQELYLLLDRYRFSPRKIWLQDCERYPNAYLQDSTLLKGYEDGLDTVRPQLLGQQHRVLAPFVGRKHATVDYVFYPIALSSLIAWSGGEWLVVGRQSRVAKELPGKLLPSHQGLAEEESESLEHDAAEGVWLRDAGD